MEHVDIPEGEIHAPHNWAFADEAERLAATITDAALINRWALQADDGSFWRLTGVAPATWVQVNPPGPQGPAGEAGPTGEQGAAGADGKSAYQVALDNGFVGDETAWLLSLKGETGDAGPAGADGQSFTVDAVGLLAERSTYDNEGPDFSFVATDTGELYFRQGTTPGVWSDPIPFGKGEKGDPGDPGADGADGRSAYQVAVDSGFVGTEAEWLASLQGAEGAQGLKGDPGDPGAPGEQGAAGADGKSAYQIAVDNGFVGTEADWLVSLEGADGPQGPKGDPGDPGTPGADGKSAYQVAVDNGFVGDEAAWLASLKGADGAQGPKGDPGDDGAPGSPGADGADGASAYEVAVNNGFVGTEAEWLASLQGEPGEQGPPGADGADFPDAPSDGKTYGRKDGTWSEISATAEPGEATVVTNPIIVATEGQTEFDIPGGSDSAIVWVFGNGRKLDPSDYTIASGGLTYSLAVAAAAGEEFQTVVFASFEVANTYTQSATDALLAEKYGKNNIVGTVSQTAGVPTGAIIESGSNANGSYTKWADGTMICAGGWSCGAGFATVNLPATFAGTPRVSVTNTSNNLSVVAALKTFNVTASSFQIACTFTNGTTAAAAVAGVGDYIAFGRWF